MADQGKAIFNPVRRGGRRLVIALISTVVGALAGPTATALTLRLSQVGSGPAASDPSLPLIGTKATDESAVISVASRAGPAVVMIRTGLGLADLLGPGPRGSLVFARPGAATSRDGVWWAAHCEQFLPDQLEPRTRRC